MDGVQDLAAVIGLPNQIEYRVTPLAGRRATWDTSGRVELENKA
jgi:hypothetical protein